MFHVAICACPGVLSDRLRCSGGYHLERGGIPLHDTVGKTVKSEQLLKINAQILSIWAKGCVCWMIVCVLSDLA